MDSKQELMRTIPSVEKVLEHPGLRGIEKDVPRWIVKEAARSVLAGLREAIIDGRLSQINGIAIVELRVGVVAPTIAHDEHDRAFRYRHGSLRFPSQN